MRVTRRGWATIAVVGFAVVMAATYGPRALNAFVAPLVVALLAAAITVSRAERPAVTRRPVDAGFVGDARTVELEVDVAAPIAGVVEDRVGEGLSVIDPAGETTLEPGGVHRYRVRFDDRGEHALGPTTVVVGDLLGLLERRFEYRSTGSVLAYPEVYALGGASRAALHGVVDATREYDREEFDRLREYQRGDSLRDVHWKSTAKRPAEDLIVKEFVAEGAVGSVDVVAESTPAAADEMAVAAASVVTFLLERGVAVGLETATRTEPAGDGAAHHRRLLSTLALTGGGRVDDAGRARADVLVSADETGTTVRAGGRELSFDRLREDALRTAIAGVRPPDDAEAPSIDAVAEGVA